MSKKGMHLWAKVHSNAGDYLIGHATEWWFNNHVMKNENPIHWTRKNCRNRYGRQWVSNLNRNYDYLVIGGGGLFLPDSRASTNSPSNWQWKITTDNIERIKIPTYVVSVGYNLFHNQTVNMPFKNSSKTRSRWKTFKHSIETLIHKSEYFSMRHRGDIQDIKELLNENVHDKINFQFCPTIDYCKHQAEALNLHNENRKTWAIEIKDDRPHRRYHNTSKTKVFRDLLRFIVYMKKTHNIEIKTMWHDKSRSLYQYLKSNNINFGFINNSVGTVKQRIKNFTDIDVLFCTAGHSQMIGHTLGCRTISLITHNKLKYFLEDIGEYKENNYVDINKDNIYDKLVKISKQLIK